MVGVGSKMKQKKGNGKKVRTARLIQRFKVIRRILSLKETQRTVGFRSRQTWVNPQVITYRPCNFSLKVLPCQMGMLLSKELLCIRTDLYEVLSTN